MSKERILIHSIHRRLLTRLLRQLRAVKVLGDLDLDIAEVALAGYALPFLLVGVCRFLGTGWSAFETAVPVVGYEAFALVALGRAVRVHVVDVREVGLESVEFYLDAYLRGMIKGLAYSSSVNVTVSSTWNSFSLHSSKLGG